jgi:predicted O-methyltransferase YrrM
MSIAEQYETATQHWTDFQSHMHRCVDLVVNLNAQHVIELGVRGGTSTRAWLQGLSVTGGRLTTVDLLPAPMLEHEGVDWRHYEGNDQDLDLYENLFAERGPADVCFLDTSHTYEDTVRELALYWPWTKNAFVLHDLYLDIRRGSHMVRRKE